MLAIPSASLPRRLRSCACEDVDRLSGESNGARWVAPASWSAAVLCRFWSVRRYRKRQRTGAVQNLAEFYRPFWKIRQSTNGPWEGGVQFAVSAIRSLIR